MGQSAPIGFRNDSKLALTRSVTKAGAKEKAAERRLSLCGSTSAILTVSGLYFPLTTHFLKHSTIINPMSIMPSLFDSEGNDVVLIGPGDICDFNSDNILPLPSADLVKIRQWLQPLHMIWNEVNIPDIAHRI